MSSNNKPVILKHQDDQPLRLGKPNGVGHSYSWPMALRDGALIIVAYLIFHWMTDGHLRIWKDGGARRRAARQAREAEVVEGNVLEAAARDSAEVQVRNGNSDTITATTTRLRKVKFKLGGSDSSSASDDDSQHVNRSSKRATFADMDLTNTIRLGLRIQAEKERRDRLAREAADRAGANAAVVKKK